MTTTSTATHTVSVPGDMFYIVALCGQYIREAAVAQPEEGSDYPEIMSSVIAAQRAKLAQLMSEALNGQDCTAAAEIATVLASEGTDIDDVLEMACLVAGVDVSDVA